MNFHRAILEVELFLAVIAGAGKELEVSAGAAALGRIGPCIDFRPHDGHALTPSIENHVTVLKWQAL